MGDEFNIMADRKQAQARRLSMLILLLFALHVLFGITAVIGVLIAHTSLAATQGTPYHSHLTWQIGTFWSALVGYSLAFMMWRSTGVAWPALLVMAFVAYRLSVHLHHWLVRKPIERKV